jgi:hypothetical protein
MIAGSAILGRAQFGIIRAVFLLFGLVISQLNWAQSTLDPGSDQSLPIQTSGDSLTSYFEPEYRKALIIPFDMTYYLSDADHDLAKRNDKTLPQVQQTLRYGLDGNVAASVMDMYSAHRILLDTLPEENSDLKRLYGAVRYRYSTPFGAQPVEADRVSTEKPGSGIRRWIKEQTGSEHEELEENKGDAYFEEGALRGPVMGQRFMHAELQDPEVLTYFYDHYNTDLFIFINQLEIRTNYAICLDRATNNFVREISVHYSIYNVEGKLFAGDVVTVLVSSNTNDLYEVMARSFPQLSATVVSGLPAPRYVRTEE